MKAILNKLEELKWCMLGLEGIIYLNSDRIPTDIQEELRTSKDLTLIRIKDIRADIKAFISAKSLKDQQEAIAWQSLKNLHKEEFQFNNANVNENHD